MTIGPLALRGARHKHQTRRIRHLHLISGVLFVAMACSVRAADSDESALPDAFRGEDLLWEIRLGTHQYTVPRIDRGRVFIGINDLLLDHPGVKRTGGGILMCLDEATGKMVWQLTTPRYMEGTKAPFHFNHWRCGVCSRSPPFVSTAARWRFSTGGGRLWRG